MNARNQGFDFAFWQAVDDMQSGAVRPIEAYLELVPAPDRDRLARMLADVLVARGPAPTPSAEQSEGYTRTLAIVDDMLGAATAAGILPSALKAMRNARGIDREHVIDRAGVRLRDRGSRWPQSTGAPLPPAGDREPVGLEGHEEGDGVAGADLRYRRQRPAGGSEGDGQGTATVGRARDGSWQQKWRHCFNACRRRWRRAA